MKIKFVHLLAISGLLLLASCKSCNDEPGCESIWLTEYVNPSLIIEIDSVNKELSLQIPNMTPGGVQGEVFQSYFTGDFNVVAKFDNFVAPSSPCGTCGRPYAEMIMYNSEAPDTVLDTSYVRAGISSTSIYTMIGLSKDEKPRIITTTSGEFRIGRFGPNMSGSVIAGGDTVSLAMTMPFNPVRFAFRLGSFNDSIVVGSTAIKITQFSVSGTTGCTLFSDQFTCNSIVP